MKMGKAKSTISDLANNAYANFPPPDKIVSDEHLSPTQKQKVLTAWEFGARLQAVTAEEGMIGGKPSQLDEIKKARADLPGETDAAPVSPTKTGANAVRYSLVSSQSTSSSRMISFP
jgi:hypothetical protein